MKALRYAKRLISFDSTSRKSNRVVSRYLEMKLAKHGFVVEKLEYRDQRNVRKVNLVAKKGSGQGGLAYFAHSDVVPAKTWYSKLHGPFEPIVKDNRLYGRGSCDMKGSIAAMLDAAQSFEWDDLVEPLYIVITSDEEVGFLGAKCVVEESKQYREMVEAKTKVIIGEPTELEVVHAHKGSVKIVATSYGEAAHSSTTAGNNSNHAMIPFLAEIKMLFDQTDADQAWQNDLFDPPTISWNVIVKDNSPALNIKPSKTTCVVYLRTMPNVDVEPLIQKVNQSGDQLGIEIQVTKFADPFYSASNGSYVQTQLKLAGKNEAKTVSYGTDGGTLTELEDKIVVGPGCIAQAHTDDEWIDLDQIEAGVDLYQKMIQHWCCKRSN